MKIKRMLGFFLAAVLAVESLPQTAGTVQAAETIKEMQIAAEAFGRDAEETSFAGVDVGLEIQTASVEGGEGVYQEGAFGVLGGDTYRDEL